MENKIKKKILSYKFVWANCNRTGVTVYTKLRSTTQTLCALEQCTVAVQEWSGAQAHGNFKTSKAITVSVGTVCLSEISWRTRQVEVKTKCPKRDTKFYEDTSARKLSFIYQIGRLKGLVLFNLRLCA